MSLYVTDACPTELIGRRIKEVIWDDEDDDGLFWLVRLNGGEKLEYGDPDGYTVVVTGLGRMPPPSYVGPDNRLRRWEPRSARP